MASLMAIGLFLMMASAAAAVHQVVQSPPPLVGDWKALPDQAPGNRTLQIVVALQRPAHIRLGEVALDRANPSSPYFRKWLSKDQVALFLKPRSDAVEAVQAWLRGEKVPFTKADDGAQFFLDISVNQAQHLFRTSISTVYNPVTKQHWHRAGPVEVPEGVAEHVAAVYGLHGLPTAPRAQPKQPEAMVKVGPKDIRTAYKVTGRGSGSTKARQAVAEFQGQFMDTSDLEKFFENLVPYAQAGDDKVYKVVGTPGHGEGVEALLDIEYIMGIAPGVKTEFWAWKNFDFCRDLK
eukprot:201847_1